MTVSTPSGTPTPKRSVGKRLLSVGKWLWATVPRRIATFATFISVVAALITIGKFAFYDRQVLEYEKALRLKLETRCTATVDDDRPRGRDGK